MSDQAVKPNRRGKAAILVWLAALVACAWIIVHTTFVADLSAFMPKLPNERQRLLAEQLRDGIVARIVMVGIEGGDAVERARLSKALGEKLRNDKQFIGVQNGDEATQARDRAYFFDQRYLLSPNVNAERFSVNGLRNAIQGSLDALAGEAGILVKHTFKRDPTSETLALIESFAGGSQPRMQEGAWASGDGQRALLILQTSAAGSDIDAQAKAQDTIREAFAALPQRKAETRVVMSGTGVFSVSSRALIETEVARLALVSTVLVLGLFWAVFRSFTLIAIGALPVLTGTAVGVAAVSLGFGNVHGLTLGFGTTLIGEAIDYSIYLFLQQRSGLPMSRFWRTFGLGVAASVVGFAALGFSSFPGLSQLGIYSIAGLLAAAAVTRWVLPVLMPAHTQIRDLAPLGERMSRHAAWLHARLRWLPWVIVVAAAAYLALHGQVWSRQLSALNPVSKAEQALDTRLRADLGAPDLRYLVSFTAPSQEAALQQAERVGRQLQGLLNDSANIGANVGVIGGFNSPASVLPSLAAQAERKAALPDSATLQSRLNEALSGLPVRAATLTGFVEDVARVRAEPPLTRDSLQGSSAAMLFDSLLIQRARDVLVLMPLRAPAGAHDGEIDAQRVAKALEGVSSKDTSPATVIDLLYETSDIFERYLGEARHTAGWGALAVLLLLFAALRSLRRTLRVAAPLFCAVVTVAAGLVLAGQQLAILHLVGLLLVVAVGSNYALFFDTGTAGSNTSSASGWHTTFASLLIANLAMVLGFVVLASSKVVVLSAVGATVAPGTFLALVYAAMLYGVPKMDTTQQ